MVLPDISSGNQTIRPHPTISYSSKYLLEFFYAHVKKHETHWSRFDEQHFVHDYFLTDWNNLLLASNMNIENLYKTFTKTFDSLLNTYALLKKNI